MSMQCNANGHRRRTLRKRVAARREPCAICGQPIDYNLPAGHPMAYELDEIVSRWKGGSPIDAKNVQPVHRCCNQQKYKDERAAQEAKRLEAPSLPKASRKW